MGKFHFSALGHSTYKPMTRAIPGELSVTKHRYSDRLFIQ